MTRCLWLLVDPVELGVLVIDDFTLTKPQSDLVLRGLDAVRSVADIAANVLFDAGELFGAKHDELWKGAYDSIIATNGAWSRLQRVRRAQENCRTRQLQGIKTLLGVEQRTSSSLDGVTTFPHHGNDWATQHV